MEIKIQSAEVHAQWGHRVHGLRPQKETGDEHPVSWPQAHVLSLPMCDDLQVFPVALLYEAAGLHVTALFSRTSD